jgi:hypothetical protein
VFLSSIDPEVGHFFKNSGVTSDMERPMPVCKYVL